jgi:tetratricopeptide (TPR) repeat protein
MSATISSANPEPCRGPLRLAAFGLLGLLWLGRASALPLVDAALAAEARHDSRGALELFLQADQAQPNDARILQKIAQQYSDLVVEQLTADQKKQYAETALGYARRAVALDPANPVNVLSLAVCHGTLAVYSDTRTKIKYSRLVREEAERARQLDPNYAWAHHLLGRWHYEVATLGATSRFLVRLLYGGLPDASLDRSLHHLRLAAALEPGELNHWLELGFACAAAGDPAGARREWARGLAMPPQRRQDEAAKLRAREALARLN